MGRQVGKTVAASREAARTSATAPPGEIGQYLVPIYSQGRKPVRLWERWCRRSGVGEVNRSDRIVRWPGGQELHLRSADRPGDVVGETPVRVDFDEAGRIPDEGFDFIAPALARMDAVQVRWGTPRGKGGRFYADYVRGLDSDGNSPFMSELPPAESRYVSFRAPSSLAPWWTPEAIDAYASTMSPAMVQQELGAQFLDAAAGPFGDFGRFCTAQVEQPHPDGAYVMGVDLARKHDFLSVRIFRVDVAGHLAREVNYYRANKQPWERMLRVVVGLAKRYNNAPMVVDATGIGDPISEQLRGLGALIAEEFVYSEKSRTELIENLIGKILTGQVVMLHKDVDPVAYQEMDDFEADPIVSRSGNVRAGVRFRYGHAPDKHDDTVMARALGIRAVGARVIGHVG